MDKEIISFLALASIKGVGFETLRKVAGRGSSFSSILDIETKAEVFEVLRGLGARIAEDGSSSWCDVKNAALARAYDVHHKLANIDAQVILRGDPRYPRQLLDLSDAPAWLFVQGNVDILSAPSVAVVGTREPSPDGIWLSRFVGYHLPDWGVPTVSGLALGIDQEIHIASLRAGVPTIAFLGTGIFSDYPRGSEKLRADIIEKNGAVVTEYLPFDTYSARNFVKRNRLQAALSAILLPVEWSVKSGTSHTVKYAAMLNRPISCLVLPYGKKPDWLGSEFAKAGKVFSVPQQQMEFSKFVLSKLKGEGNEKPRQLSLL